MKTATKRVLSLLLAVVLVLSLGVGAFAVNESTPEAPSTSPTVNPSVSPDPSAPTQYITLDKTSVTLYPEQTETINAYASIDSVVSATWTSSDTKVATVKDGTITAVAPGTATITIEGTVQGVKCSATCSVTVKANSVQSIKVTDNSGKEVSSITLKKGATAQLTATGTLADGSTKVINNWVQTSSPRTATLTSAGKVTANNPGTTILTVRDDASGKTATVNVTVYEVKSIKLVTPTDITDGKATVETEITCDPANVTVTPTDITFKSSNDKIATVAKNSVDPTKADVTFKALGEVTITAELDGKTGKCTIVNSGIELSASELTIGAKDGGSVTATIYPTDGSVEWSISNTDKFSITTSADRKTASVTVKAGVQKGDTATLTATLKKGGETIASKTVPITVGDISEVTAVKLNKSAVELTVGASTKLGYTLTPSTGAYASATWFSSDPSIADVDQSGNVTAKKAGTTQINISIKVNDEKTINDACTVTVNAKASDISYSAKVSTTRVKFSTMFQTKLSTEFRSVTGATLSTADAELTLDIPTSTTTGAVYASSSTTTAMKGEQTLAWSKLASTYFRANKSGTYEIPYTLTDGNGTISGKLIINVSSQDADVKVVLDNADDTYYFKSFTDESASVYSQIRSKVNSVSGEYPSYVKFGAASGTSYGNMYSGSSTVGTTSYYTASNTSSNLYKMTFEPKKAGTYTRSYTAYDSDKNELCSGTLTIEVPSSSTKGKTITISLDSDTDYYYFSKKDDDGDYAYSAIKSAIRSESGKTYSYIKFSSSVSSTSSKVGTLYANDDEDTISSSRRYYEDDSETWCVYDLYFSVKKDGTYTREFTAYDSSNNDLGTYTLKIVVGGSSTGDTITIKLDKGDEYTFDEKDNDGNYATSEIRSAIRSESGESYDYIKFSSVSSSSSKIGTLYANDDEDDIKTTTKYYYSGSRNDYVVSDLYFVADKEGTYTRDFTAYNDDGDSLGTYTLKIVVGSESGTDGDIYVTTTTGKTITLGESMFEDWYQNETTSSYHLAYVTFDDASNTNGTFKTGSSTFKPGVSTKFYTKDYDGSTGSNAKYLADVKYTAPTTSGYVTVDFTCYGGTTSSRSNVEKSGTLTIFYTKDGVSTITYSVKAGGTVNLKESDFISVYKSAMGTSSSTTKFYIELDSVPSKGTLYVDYTSASKTGTKLTSSNISKYKFYANGSSSNTGIGDLTYVAASSSSTAVSVNYTAYSSTGKAIYQGKITFGSTAAASISVTSYSDGYTFKGSDFYSSSDSDPIKTIAFAQPTSGGKLLKSVVAGKGTAVTTSDKFYTNTSVSGATNVNTVTFIPTAGYAGNVSINYTAVTSSGTVVTGTLTVAVKSKTASSTFTDVNASGVGKWAADSVDYAKAWGLVNGTGATTFAPNATMDRGMLVTVLYRAAGSPSVTGTCPFNDVKSGTYYYNAVIWAYKNGIVTGTTSTTFNPTGAVERQQVAAILYRYAKYMGLSLTNTGSLSGYTDKDNVASYATDAMTWAVGNGYITSASESAKVLNPNATATRAQVCVMLHRFLTK